MSQNITTALRWAVDENNVNPGLLGFTVVALLGLATWFLIKSMTRHLRKVDLPRDEGPEDPPPAG